jgi:ubiquinone/menaquinone biosynthesis C-methylase UbiE/uncharacterized protein YbaR (Trm112 family)
MLRRLLDLLRCPACGESLTVVGDERSEEIEEGVLTCPRGHTFPVCRGIPRFVTGEPDRVGEVFGLEWAFHELGDRTWNTDLPTRVSSVLLEALHLDAAELADRLVLDVGCGNGSQSVAYTAHVREVVAVDISDGVDLGQVFRWRWPDARPDAVHFVQADLHRLPLPPRSFDVVHCDAVLHHTPDPRAAFTSAVSYLRPGGLLYVWLYRHEPWVTPLVEGVRSVTTRLPPRVLARISWACAIPFVVVTRALTASGLRRYPRMARREAALALMDALAPPHAHCHTADEVRAWFVAEQFTEVWVCHQNRKGFGMCGRR